MKRRDRVRRYERRIAHQELTKARGKVPAAEALGGGRPPERKRLQLRGVTVRKKKR